jgi:hypothetical protein
MRPCLAALFAVALAGPTTTPAAPPFTATDMMRRA